ncbi:MAG TPA: tetratricopeptide repeat protein [Vicinamibacterales bacterium]|nr:tetratricopeptide repeat protein [Vicinamibacterales bacterium]
MSIDRATTLKNAEKLLRQGKLTDAIAEYARVVDDQPRDWNTANILGDLYVRNKQIDRAIEQFLAIADSLVEQGFLPKAGAVYKKVLKLKPDNEHALLRGADVAAQQGLLADARNNFKIVAERRRAKGDQRGVAQIVIQLAALDPEDVPARLAGARARLDQKDTEGALRDFKELAAMLSENGRQAEALEVLAEAARLSPEDAETRDRLLAVHLEAGDFNRAREFATTPQQFKDLAARLEGLGQSDEALAMLREAASLDPGDTELRAQLAQAYVARNDPASAAEFVSIESAGGDVALLLGVAEGHLLADRTEDGMAFIRHIVEHHPAHRQDVAIVGWNVAGHNPELGFRLVEMAANAAVAESDWPSAAAALQEFVTRVPKHLAALMRLVEVCVDGGLEATLYTAQAQLADAYLAAGSANEARFIAEDLVAREPWDRVNIERFRRALTMSGEADPDAVIADRLSGESPFTSTDLSFTDEMATVAPELVPELALEQPRPAEELPTAEGESANAAGEPALPAGEPALPAGEPPLAEVSFGSLALEAAAEPVSDTMEVDLNVVLSGMEAEPASAAHAPVEDLEGVFARLRSNLTQRSPVEEEAETQYAAGRELFESGRFEDSLSPLEIAAQSPRFRFMAGSLAGRAYQGLKLPQRAIEWFEKAAQAPPPTAEDGRLLLYDLADALESVGDVSRALAICLELQAVAGNYRDVPARVDRLAKVQARG